MAALRPVQTPKKRRTALGTEFGTVARTPFMEKPLDIATPPLARVEPVVFIMSRNESHHRTAGRPTVHPGDAIVSRTVVASGGLQRHESEQPVFQLDVTGDRLLNVVVTSRNEEVQGVRGWHRRPLQSQQEPAAGGKRGWTSSSTTIRQGLSSHVVGSQSAQQIGPFRSVAWQILALGAPKRQRAKLHEEHVPRGTLMGSERCESSHLTAGHCGQKPGK